MSEQGEVGTSGSSPLQTFYYTSGLLSGHSAQFSAIKLHLGHFLIGCGAEAEAGRRVFGGFLGQRFRSVGCCRCQHFVGFDEVRFLFAEHEARAELEGKPSRSWWDPS